MLVVINKVKNKINNNIITWTQWSKVKNILYLIPNLLHSRDKNNNHFGKHLELEIINHCQILGGRIIPEVQEIILLVSQNKPKYS